MSSKETKGKKRSKSYYKKCAYGAKKARLGAHILESGIQGFLVMCNNNESGAVRESYNILNEYADKIYGLDQAGSSQCVDNYTEAGVDDDDDVEEDIEKALQKEVEEIKNTNLKPKRFQNVKTKAKNCVFIKSTVKDPTLLAFKIMEDIANNGLKKARYAARILPIQGTCKAHVDDIENLASSVLPSVFSSSTLTGLSSYTILYKMRNNNGSNCDKMQVTLAIRKVVSAFNPKLQFSWSDYQVAILVEVVCTICCLGVAPDYIKLRKYNLQELQQGPKTSDNGTNDTQTNTVNQEVSSSNKAELVTDIGQFPVGSSLGEKTDTADDQMCVPKEVGKLNNVEQLSVAQSSADSSNNEINCTSQELNLNCTKNETL